MTEREGDPSFATAMQDGMLTYYLEQVKASDVTVEARIEKEPYDFRDGWGSETKAVSVTTPEHLRKLVIR